MRKLNDTNRNRKKRTLEKRWFSSYRRTFFPLFAAASVGKWRKQCERGWKEKECVGILINDLAIHTLFVCRKYKNGGFIQGVKNNPILRKIGNVHKLPLFTFSKWFACFLSIPPVFSYAHKKWIVSILETGGESGKGSWARVVRPSEILTPYSFTFSRGLLRARSLIKMLLSSPQKRSTKKRERQGLAFWRLQSSPLGGAAELLTWEQTRGRKRASNYH